MEKRSRFKIFVAILEAANNGAAVTKIVYGANINFKIAQDYLDYLLESELIEIVSKNGKKVYKTTEKGKEFVKRFSELEGMTK